MAAYKSPGNLLPFFKPFWKVHTYTSWWFQPLWKIFVKLDHFARVRGENKNLWVAITSSGKTIHFQALDTLKFLKGSKNTLPETNIWMVGRRSGFLFGASWAYFQKFWLVSGRVSRWKLRGSHNVRPNSPKKNIVPEIKKKSSSNQLRPKKHYIYIYTEKKMH